jgi:hypothetical protein
MNNNFDRNSIREFFRNTIYADIDQHASKEKSSRRPLTEGLEDHSLTKLDPDDANRLAQAIVTGINLEFDINASGPDLVELEEQVQYHMAKHPGLPEILFEIAMDAIYEYGGDASMRDQKGNVVVTDDDVGPDSNYDSVSSADGPTRDSIVELLAGAVLDAKTDGGWTGIFDDSAMMELVTAMRSNGDIDIHDWNSHTISAKDVRDRVAQLEKTS